MTDTTNDKKIHRAYRDGYLQAWREWCGCASLCRTAPGFQDQYLICDEDMKKLKKKKAAIKKRTD